MYFFNDPGPDGFLDGPGIQLMRKNREMVGIIGAEMQAWGRHLLYSQFDCRAATGTRPVSLPMSENPWWHDLVHPAYPEAVGKKVPAVQAVVQRHPRGLFLFVLPNMEINFFAESVQATVPRPLPQGAKAYRLSPGLPEAPIASAADQSFTVDCGAVYAAEAFLVSNDTSFVDQIRDDLDSAAPEICRRSVRLATWDLEDVRRFLDTCDESPARSQLLAQIDPIGAAIESNPLSAHCRAERLFRAALASGLRDRPPYDGPNATFRRAQAIDPAAAPRAGENLALARRGATARATMTQWVFGEVADQNNSAHLAIDGRLSPPATLPWGGMNTAWVFSRNSAEPYPILTIELPEARTIGEVRLKQLAQREPARSQGITRLAIEFVEDGSVECFDLKDIAAAEMVDLRFPAREARTLHVVPLEYAPNTQTQGIVEFEVYSSPVEPEANARMPITRVHRDDDWTTFGW